MSCTIRILMSVVGAVPRSPSILLIFRWFLSERRSSYSVFPSSGALFLRLLRTRLTCANDVEIGVNSTAKRWPKFPEIDAGKLLHAARGRVTFDVSPGKPETTTNRPPGEFRNGDSYVLHRVEWLTTTSNRTPSGPDTGTVECGRCSRTLDITRQQWERLLYGTVTHPDGTLAGTYYPADRVRGDHWRIVAADGTHYDAATEYDAVVARRRGR
ncbi:hypothetical protein [Amycolatopsis sp. NPDC006125]|uniref:hypothetical protein n=1 Tax=Amycolatopsis sp. NPDC006125 TaxID=3156730 RepID=UPI00339FB9AD